MIHGSIVDVRLIYFDVKNQNRHRMQFPNESEILVQKYCI